MDMQIQFSFLYEMSLAIVICSDINPSLFSPRFDGKAQKKNHNVLFLTLVSSRL